MAKKQSVPRFNPRSGDRRGPRQMPGRSASSLWYGLVFLLLLGGAQMYFLASAGRSVGYSEFKQLLKSGTIDAAADARMQAEAQSAVAEAIAAARAAPFPAVQAAFEQVFA